MAGGLKNAKTELAPDGVTVTTTFESASAAREHQAALESSARQIEGGWGSKLNVWLDRSLASAEETGGLFSDRSLNIMSWIFAIMAIVYAWNAWGHLLPVKGLDLLLSMFGGGIIIAMKLSAARIDEAAQAGDKMQVYYLRGILISGLALSALVSTSLSASIAIDQETGRTDNQTRIDALRLEQSGLQLTIAQKPGVTADAEQKLIDSLKLKQAVNSKGTVLQGEKNRIGSLVGDCKGGSYYVTVYCPTILEMEAQRDTAAEWEHAKARFDAIPVDIATLEAQRPAQSSTFALFQKLGGRDTDWLALLAPAFISLFLDLLMILVTYLAHRAARTPAAEDDEEEVEDPPEPISTAAVAASVAAAAAAASMSQ